MTTCGTCGGPLLHVDDMCPTCLPRGIPDPGRMFDTGPSLCPTCFGTGAIDGGSDQGDTWRCDDCGGTGVAKLIRANLGNNAPVELREQFRASLAEAV